MESKNARPIQEAAPRDTEGKITIATKTKSGQTHSERKRGRPKGSKNKPKALINKEVASDLLGVVKQTLPPELYKEMQEAVRDGKNISTVNEAKILMKMMGPPIWQRLIQEAERQGKKQVTDIDPELVDEFGETDDTGEDKTLNERIKVYLQLMQFVHKMESNDDESDNSKKPIISIFAQRGLDAGRLKFLVGVESEPVGGNADGTGRSTIEVGAFSGEISERPLDVSDSEQEQTVRVLDNHRAGDNTRGSNEA